jgi:hypothetical protein
MVLMGVGTLVGWGFVVNSSANWLEWQGYFMGLLGGKETTWAWANLGVLLALAIGFLGTLIFSRSAIRRQESLN